MYPHLRDEEARVIENTIRLAVDSIINVLASVDCARTREHERVLAEREREIGRLATREKHFERELRLLRRRRRRRRRRHVCGTGGGGQVVDRSSVSSHQPADPEEEEEDEGEDEGEGSDPWPGCGDGDHEAGPPGGDVDVSFSRES